MVIAVQKGHAHGPTISNSPADDRPASYQQTDEQVRVGVQQGRPPDLTNRGLGESDHGRAGIGNEVGRSEDTFEVYRGGVEYPLDSSPVWRYMAKDALNGPRVEAVEQFRKVIAESEEQRQRRKKP